MKIFMIAIGNKMPHWVDEGYREYARRMPGECSLNLMELPAEKRPKNMNRNVILKKECERFQSSIPKSCRVVVMDSRGEQWDTENLARQLDAWKQDGRNVSILIGGPEGIDDVCKKQADLVWSLSPLTLPHPMVRIIVAEQLYRAWTILSRHPYHRSE